jgi:hypothetical protein
MLTMDALDIWPFSSLEIGNKPQSCKACEYQADSKHPDEADAFGLPCVRFIYDS